MPDASSTTHTVRIPVRWGDQDAFGHVNNAVFLTYCEQARIEVMQRLPSDWATDETAPVLVSASLRFKRPVTYPAVILVRMTFGEPGHSSLPTTFEIVREDDPETLCCAAEATMVWIDRASGRPAPIPDTLCKALSATD